MEITSMKPKVLIVHNYYQIPGGEDIVVRNEKRLLENHGHEVFLYSRDNSELKVMSKFQKLFLPLNTLFSMRTYMEVKRIIKKQNINIVHVHNTLNLVSPSVYFASFACKIPVVQTIHNFRLLCPAGTFYRNGKICEDCVSNGLGLACAIKNSCYRGSKIQTLANVLILKINRFLGVYKKLNYICLTEFNRRKLLDINKGKKHIFNDNKIYVKPNFADSEVSCIPYEKRKNQFVFAGRIDKLKGIHLLLEAWKGIKDSELVICGTGPEENWCKQYIAEKGLTNVKMLGYVNNEEVKKIIGESKALILPTQWYEGFPMTIIESFSVGTPVIGGNIGNVGSVIENGVSGLTFQFDSVISLREAISKVNNHNLFRKGILASKYNSRENYNKLLKIYENVLTN